MILVRDLNDGFGDGPKRTHWIEHVEAEELEKLIAQMQKSLEGDENAPKPRAYEVLEVEVTRKVIVHRSVEHVVNVNVQEEELAA
jgi:DNA relaxase NicK